MIEYSYMIERDQGNMIEKYLPQLPTKLPILSSIEGPNSSGKSTLLHLIGICFGGHKSRSINESLVGKMSALLDTSYQNLEFDIKIESLNETLHFIKKNGKDNIDKFRVCGDIEESIDVDREYELIYDIPINPVERLKELITEVKIKQESTELRLRNFQMYLSNELEKAKNAKDPFQIKTLEEQIRALKFRIEKRSDEVIEKTSDLEKVQKCKCVKLHCDYMFKQSNHNFIANKKMQSTKQELNKNKIMYNKLKEQIYRQKENLLKEYEIVKTVLFDLELLKEEDKDSWGYLNINDIFNTGIVGKTHTQIIQSFMEKFIALDKNSEQEIEQFNMKKELVSLLHRFVDKDVELPGEDISLKKLVLSLEKEIDTQKKIIKEKEKLNNALQSLKIIKNDVRYVFSEEYLSFQKIKLQHEEFNMETSDVEDNDYNIYIEKCRNDGIALGIDVTDKEVIKNYLKMIKDDSDIESKINYSEGDYQNYIEKTKDAINSLKEKNDNDSGYLKGSQIKLEDIKTRPENEYKQFQVEIGTLINEVGNLLSRINTYKEYTNKLSRGMKEDSKEFNDYVKALGDYMAIKLGKVLHVNKAYEIKTVDLLKSEFKASDGTIIRFSDMGTGQSQSAYLKSKLNSNSGKKIVALFDEIAMMDSKSLHPIYEKINEMYGKGQLLTAIVVQKGDEMRVTSIKEVI